MKIIKTLILSLVVFTTAILADVININTASKAELMVLKGVGESKAEAIMQYRRTHKFKSVSDIKNVSGIGDAIYNDNKRLMKTSGITKVSTSKAEDSGSRAAGRKSTEDKAKKTKKKSKKVKSKAKKKARKAKFGAKN